MMPQPIPINAKTFAGTWRLADAYAETDGRREAFPLGDGAHGLIIYDEAGFMSAQLMRAGRGRFTARDPDEVPLNEFKEAYLGYTSYYGRFTLNVAAKTVTHHVEGSLAAGWIGGDQLRYFTFGDDGTLTLRTPPMRTVDGSKVVNTLVWRRAS
jgi:hypothetical protein